MNQMSRLNLNPPLTTRGVSLSAGEPLYKRAPSRDEQGKPYSDFMMLLTGFRDLSANTQQQRLAQLSAILVSFKDVVFADLNIPRNLLWISITPTPGIIIDISTAIRSVMPEAKLIASEGSR